jgi:hypothetical protein
MDFPNLGIDLLYEKKRSITYSWIELEGRYITKKVKDYLLMHLIFLISLKFLREAALDLKVTTIKISFLNS